MRAREIEESIFKRKMSPQKITFLRMRQSFAHQSPIALARSQVVTLDIRSVDFLVAQYGGDNFFGTKDNPATDFNHAPLLTSFVDLSVKQMRVQLATRRFARTTTASLRRKRLRGAVIGNESCHVSGQLITGEQGRSPVRPGFEGRQKSRRLLLATLV